VRIEATEIVAETDVGWWHYSGNCKRSVMSHLAEIATSWSGVERTVTSDEAPEGGRN
jgi:hypothetical protein